MKEVSDGRSEELPSPCDSPSARSSKRKAENESGSAVLSVEQPRGIPSSVDWALDHIVGQLEMLTVKILIACIVFAKVKASWYTTMKIAAVFLTLAEENHYFSVMRSG
ncbi:hypothetical protein EK904_001631 [Melospiza melodia maxima]|nr:hypothetical protein EK904_001631 [Melospiza melodia maxima]